jgi:hypothetical protein
MEFTPGQMSRLASLWLLHPHRVRFDGVLARTGCEALFPRTEASPSVHLDPADVAELGEHTAVHNEPGNAPAAEQCDAEATDDQ